MRFYPYSFFPLLITPSFVFSKSLPKSLFRPYASLKMGKKIGQKLAIFQPNFCPQTTTSCGQTLLFLLFSTILHHYYTLNVLGEREHVHAHALRHAVSLLLKVLQVPDQCLWIAGDVDDSVGADPDYGAHEFFGAAASGRIH